jgi:hypothetical protein
VQFDERKVCPLMDDNKLCMIHREMGEEALSATCSTYPRLKTHYENETRHLMTLSCPEVARMVLFEENSMRLHEDAKLVQRATINLLKKASVLMKLVSLFIFLPGILFKPHHAMLKII